MTTRGNGSPPASAHHRILLLTHQHSRFSKTAKYPNSAHHLLSIGKNLFFEMIHRSLLMNSSHISYKSCTTYIIGHTLDYSLPKTTLATHFAPVARSQGPMNDQLSAQQRRRFIRETTTTHFALNIYQKTTPSQHTSCGIFIFKTTLKGLFIQRIKLLLLVENIEGGYRIQLRPKSFYILKSCYSHFHR